MQKEKDTEALTVEARAKVIDELNFAKETKKEAETKLQELKMRLSKEEQTVKNLMHEKAEDHRLFLLERENRDEELKALRKNHNKLLLTGND